MLEASEPLRPARLKRQVSDRSAVRAVVLARVVEHVFEEKVSGSCAAP